MIIGSSDEMYGSLVEVEEREEQGELAWGCGRGLEVLKGEGETKGNLKVQVQVQSSSSSSVQARTASFSSRCELVTTLIS